MYRPSDPVTSLGKHHQHTTKCSVLSRSSLKTAGRPKMYLSKLQFELRTNPTNDICEAAMSADITPNSIYERYI